MHKLLHNNYSQTYNHITGKNDFKKYKNVKANKDQDCIYHIFKGDLWPEPSKFSSKKLLLTQIMLVGNYTFIICIFQP